MGDLGEFPGDDAVAAAADGPSAACMPRSQRRCRTSCSATTRHKKVPQKRQLGSVGPSRTFLLVHGPSSPTTPV